MCRRSVVTVVVALLSLCSDFLATGAQPHQPSAEELLADVLQLVQVGRFPEALRPLRQLNTAPLRAQLTPVWQRRLPFLLGYAYFQSGDYGKATLHFEHARDTYRELWDYTIWYVAEGLRRLERFRAARTAYQRYLDAFPDGVHRPEVLFQAAEVSARLGERQRATELYERYQREYPEGARRGEVSIGLGMMRRDMGDSAGALREWRYLWLEHPEDPAAAMVPDLEKTLPGPLALPAVTSEDLYRRAQRLHRLNRHRDALQAFALAQEAAHDQALSTEILYQIGLSQYHARDNTLAVQTFQQVDASAPSGPLAPASLLMQARLYLRIESDENFLQIARTLTQRFPNSKQAEEVGYLLGHFYRNRGHVTQAMRAFQQIVDRGKASEFADDAWWYMGWLLYGTGDYEQAARTWGKLLGAYPASALVADALYWQARGLERAGRPGEARARYERLRTSHRQTFYSYLATARLRERAPWTWEADRADVSSQPMSAMLTIPDTLPNDASDAHAARGKELWAMRLFASAGEELELASTQAANGLIWQARAAQAFHWAGEHHRAMRLLRRHGKPAAAQAIALSQTDLQEMTYPLGALQRLEVSTFDGLDPLFVAALIMAESDWNPRAFSRVGARGLMQLMPTTGRRVAEGIGVAIASDDQLYDPSLNVRLGVTYLGELNRRFEGKLPLVLASYNAGEDQVRRWWSKRQGDDIEEFIANMPFRETRRYVQRVYVYYAEYQRIYRGAPG
ncbi:MAG TPA: transglycosylase SLT domain-containing protein [Candidatus Tectomicrobia bacterium]|nr:transglycosylase SLT domain-containing protein [Candidatus Tectomicrobia bacterium]